MATETRRLVRTDSPGRPPRLSHSSWTMISFLSCPFPFWLGGSFMAQLSKVLKPVRWAGSIPFPPVSLQRQVVCCCGRCSCFHHRGEPVSSYFSMDCCSVVSHWCKWCMFIMLPCSQRALILVLEHVGNFGVRLPPGCSRHGVSVHCLCVQMLSFYATRWPVLPTCMRLTLVSWYVASMLCCHCWMFNWSDADVNGYPSVGYDSFVRPCRSLCGITYLFSSDLFFCMKSVVYHG